MRTTLLAHRAGAKLKTLVIDAIRAIQDEFEKILIVTRLSDFKQAFPTRIEISTTPRGSVTEVV